MTSSRVWERFREAHGRSGRARPARCQLAHHPRLLPEEPDLAKAQAGFNAYITALDEKAYASFRMKPSSSSTCRASSVAGWPGSPIRRRGSRRTPLISPARTLQSEAFSESALPAHRSRSGASAPACRRGPGRRCGGAGSQRGHQTLRPSRPKHPSNGARSTDSSKSRRR